MILASLIYLVFLFALVYFIVKIGLVITTYVMTPRDVKDQPNDVLVDYWSLSLRDVFRVYDGLRDARNARTTARHAPQTTPVSEPLNKEKAAP